MKTLKEFGLFLLGVAAFMAILGYVGRFDYASEVVNSMPEEAYYSILDTLGDDCSEVEIAEEYMKNRDYYDTLNIW